MGIEAKNRQLKIIREIGSSLDRVVSFGCDRSGGIYTIGYNQGMIYKINFEGAVFE